MNLIRSQEKQIRTLTATVRSLHELVHLKDSLYRINPSDSRDFQFNSQLHSVSSDVKSQEDRLRSLENVIVSTPEKALVIPMLRKDMDAISFAQAKEDAALHAEIDRLYDYNKLFVGTLITVILTCLAIIIPVVKKQ